MEVTLITGIFTLVGIIITNILQYINTRKKNNADLVNQLLEQALKLNKQELDTIRGFNKDLEEKVNRLEQRIANRDSEIERLKVHMDALEKENNSLRRELDKCIKEDENESNTK